MVLPASSPLASVEILRVGRCCPLRCFFPGRHPGASFVLKRLPGAYQLADALCGWFPTDLACTAGALSASTFALSTQAAQYAAAAVRSALLNPKPPLRAGNVATFLASWSVLKRSHPRSAQKHVQIASSWRRAYGVTMLGGRTRKKWFARGTPQNVSRSHAHWRSSSCCTFLRKLSSSANYLYSN